MSYFDIDSHLSSVYSSYPEAVRKPIIGITANFNDGEATMARVYYQQVVDAGGTPVLIPPVADKEVIINTLDNIDGLLLSGGADFNPLWTGEEPLPQLHRINNVRDLPELLITQLAYNRQIPMLGICRGMQTLAVALGGKVMQDIAAGMETPAVEEPVDKKKSKRSAQEAPVEKPVLIKHSQDGDRNLLSHSVNIDKDSILYKIYKSERIFVNSFHHQAVSDAGKRFRVTAKAPDGVVEAMESSEFKSILGVQWHPECLEEEGRKLFSWLVAQASNFKLAKGLHERVLTLDTHCDTPMFFPKGADFARRDDRLLVDLTKMTEGRLDATIMVAYLPQKRWSAAEGRSRC